MTSTKADSGPPVQLGRLFVVATPIGSLDDITLRAVRVLGEVDAIVAEDTRRTRTLCEHHGISTALRSFHAHSPHQRVTELVDEMRAGARLALVTDAGTPVVSDPGIRLVDAARDADVAVESIPGPSAVTAALSVAGLRCDTFRFVGFLPRSGRRRERALATVASEPGASVIFESPGRAARTLSDLADRLGPGRVVAVCRELSKMHEEVVRGPAGELAERWQQQGPRGEITLVVGGLEAPGDAEERAGDEEALPEPGRDDQIFAEELDARAREWLRAGHSPRDVARDLARLAGVPRREAYQRVLRLRSEQE